MSPSRAFAIRALLAALSGIAAAYVLTQWARHRSRQPPHDEPKPSPPNPPQQHAPSPDTPHHPDPNNDPPPARPDLPLIRTHTLPPPLPNARALPTGSPLGSNPDAMTSSVSLHTLDSVEDDNASQITTSDADSEPFVDVLSPPPAHVITRRRSVRNHDLFAASHISFSELGNLVAPQNESH